jgi:tetratricopeptide (TPR) repeat protein
MQVLDRANSPRATHASGYSLRHTARLIGVSEAQVRQFVRDGFVDPQRGSGREVQFSFQDLVLLRTATELLGRLSPRKVRRSLQRLKAQLPEGRGLSAVRISAEGDRVVVHDGAAKWNPDSGQTLLDFAASDTVIDLTAMFQRSAGTPTDAEDWYERGCELEATSVGEARAAYEEALALDAAHPDAHVNLGRILHECGEVEAAEAHYREAVEAAPTHVTALYDLGVSLQDQGRMEEAGAAYRAALDLDGGYADAHFNLVLLYEELGRLQEALRHLQDYRRLIGR